MKLVSEIDSSEIDYSAIDYSEINYSRDLMNSTARCSSKLNVVCIVLVKYLRFVNMVSNRLIKTEQPTSSESRKGAIGPYWRRKPEYFLKEIHQDNNRIRGPLQATLENDRELESVLSVNIKPGTTRSSSTPVEQRAPYRIIRRKFGRQEARNRK